MKVSEETKQLLATQEKPKRWYHYWLLWTLAALATAAFFAWPHAKVRYHRWNAERQTRRAADFLARNDLKHAILDARSALDENPADPDATRIVATALEKSGSAQAAASWRSRLDTLEPGNPENILSWASDSLASGDVTEAERILGLLKPGERDNDRYHAIAAGAAMAKRDTAEAEKHWAEAARLNPQEERYRLTLAILRLGSKDQKLRESAVDILKEISRKPPKSIEALRALLADATKDRDWRRAKELADALVTDPGATFEDKLTKLGTLRAMDALESTDYLSTLRNAAIVNPADFYTLLMWMNQHDLALVVSDWTRTLPPDVLGSQPVCVAIADAHARSLEWGKLRDYLEQHTWGDLEYMRRAFLARALDHLEEAADGAHEWKDGIAAATSRPDARQCLERMARAAINWGWQQRAEDVMWTLSATADCPRWVLDGLWSLCLARSETVQLQKLAGIRAQADPKSTTLRNTFAFFSLLTHSEEGNPNLAAEKLFTENPGNATIAITRGLSLYQQGKVAEALAVTASLPPAELQKPQVALYHGIFLTANGETAKAAEYLAVARDWKMFAEEKALLENAKHLVERANAEKGISEAAKAARAAQAAKDMELEKAVEAARAARALKAARDLETEKAVEAARAARAAKAAQDAGQPPKDAR